ncbi:MAG: hypothetical protein JJU36_01235 [Phycisphaeraceae bacterium]|nr:hypothetical protein [Phycisphaeraceae bacterium]
MFRRTLPFFLIVLISALLVPGQAHAQAQRPLEAGHVVLRLIDAGLPHGQDHDARADLDFEFELDADGNWASEVWAYGMNYAREGHFYRSLGKMDNHGQLLSHRRDDDTTHLDVAITFMGHPHIGQGMIPHRWGRYHIQVQREGDQYSGTYTGLFNGWPVRGKVEGRIQPPMVKNLADVPALDPGEHPRLIFRRHHLETIRDRARNTPEGRAMLQRLRERLEGDRHWGNPRIPPRFAAGYGVLYQITGEREAADEARDIVAQIIAGRGQHGRMLQRAPRVMGTALAYDLCYEVWDEDFRIQVATWLEQAAWDVLNMGGGGGLNDHEHSNWMGIAFSGAGVAALAILGDRVDFPGPPAAPPHLRLSPPDDYKPGRDVPIADLQSGVMPRTWLMVGPFDTASGDDFLAPIGGRAAARPQRGQQVESGDVTRRWELTTEFENDSLWQHDHFTGPQPALDLLVPIKRAYHSTSYYHLALRAQRAGWYRFLADTQAGGEGAVAFIDGHRLQHGDVLRLEPGVYPLTIEISVGSTEPWGRILMQPRFETISNAEAEGLLAIAQARYQRVLSQWQRDHEAWINSGKRSIRAAHLFDRAQRGMIRHLHASAGDRGFYIEGEGYLRFTMTVGMLPFLHAQRIALGQVFTEASGQVWLLTLPLITGIGPGGERPAYGPAGWGNINQQEERSGAFAMGLSNVPAEYLPAARWWFDRVFGVEGGNGTFNIHLPDQAGYALMNYPFDVQPKNPGQVLPRAVHDRHHGYFAFRKEWGQTEQGHASPNDLLAVFYARAAVRRYVHQASRSPNIRIVGFGHRFADIDRVAVRENIDGWLYGEVTHAQLDPETGNGSVTADISRQYQADQRDEGVSALRAFAVDYSGRSGAAGLYAVVDIVEGLSGHTWTMATGARPEVDGNRFTVQRGNGRLSGIVITPGEARITADRAALRITGDGRFFVVMTLDEGDSDAEMTVTGEGLDSRVRVGQRTVRFDGRTIVID